DVFAPSHKEYWMTVNNKECPVCHACLVEGLQDWHHECPACGYESAALEPVINSDPAHERIDEQAREDGLRALRVANFTTLLERIKAKKPGGRLLEVGCAHGWFLELAQKSFEVVGIEPDQAVCKAVSHKGLPVRQGYFPQALEPQERFDVIVFNDVIEHIPDISQVVEQCHRHLNDGGLLVLNLPSSDGVFYRLSKVLARFSLRNPFERLWQKGLPSPHLHYFNRRNLEQLISQHGFATQADGKLPTLSRDGLHARISYTGDLGRFSRTFIYACIALALPILNRLPGDIFYSISQKRISD
ncbi:class I SAM-dependent methyltransferase, partial [Pseudomonas aeruginosa]